MVCHGGVLTILVGVHHIIYTTSHLVDTHVATVIDLHRFVPDTLLGGDNHHAIGSTRTVDGSSRGILKHLKCFNIVWREVTDGCSHGYTIYNIKGGGVAKGTDTTDTYRRVCSRLSVGGDLHTGNFPLEHG